MRIIRFFLVVMFVTVLANVDFAQQNYKIRQTMSMNGQKSETTVYVKGSRKRTEGGGFMGMGGDVATVEQCDLKRDLKISDKKKMYAIEPFDDGTDMTTPTPTTTTKPKSTPTVKGGTVTYISNTTDTGERKQMFGLTARHIKTSMSMEASPDACMKSNMKMETDGWYVDLPEFSCPMTSRQQVPQMPTERSSGGCRDKMIFKNTGAGKLGFALTEIRTMSNEGMSFSQSVETLEFSKATLDAALFDIPTGYALTDNSQNLYGKPDMAAMMKNMGGDDENKPKTSTQNNPAANNNSAPQEKKAGTLRIGVFAPTNKSGENVSLTNLQTFLVQKLTSGKVEAIAISSEADARSANCDYVLASDFSKLKQSTTSKVGGLFGKVTGGDPNALKNYDVQVDFKLVSLTGGKMIANKATNKTESDVDKAAEAALNLEATAILSGINP